MTEYNPKEIEGKWQKEWQKSGIYQTRESSDKPKFYILDMFPYVSGEGIHVGHPKGYIATDIVSRMKRMQGFNVLHPMGFDAFGLPAENYAIKTKTNPVIAVAKNIKRYKEQLEMIGFDYDWSREISTSDPNFYKWTQWIFLKLFEKGLAYESQEPVNWCPVDKTILANEDVEDGKCERCGSMVEKRPIRQWVLKITDYADRLLDDLEELDWPESIKTQQRNWIGRSEGAEIEFEGSQTSFKVKVFTTRPDTIFGATFVVMAGKEDKFTGKYVTNPATKEKIPVWEAEYVMSDYGTGAIMGVPAHDQRDFEFAKKHDLPIKNVINPYPNSPVVGGVYPINQSPNLTEEISRATKKILAGEFYWTKEGTLRNSPGFDGLSTEKAREKITKKFGEKKVKYKLRDWVFSRQRYWGEPIPVLRDGDKVIPLKEEDLPLKLPEVKSYEPTGTEESPLANIPEWINVKVGDKIFKRESNTMPQWAGSSWYYLRFMDPRNDQVLVDKEKEKYWNKVDLYVGGAEHATRHLIYARFWHKFLFDIGVVSTGEPFKRLQHVGLIIAEDGRKMSKRWGNIINPDDIISTFGADTLRMYEMFMGPFDQSVSWNSSSIVGVRRFLEKVWRLQSKISKGLAGKGQTLGINSQGLTLKSETLMHQTVKKVSDDIESMGFNTAVSTLMIYVNALDKQEKISQKEFETFLLLLAPFAPHITEELWHELGYTDSIHTQKWPTYDPKKLLKDEITLAVQIDGKVRASLTMLRGQNEDEIKTTILSLPQVKKWLDGKEPKKIIIVPDRVVSIVT